MKWHWRNKEATKRSWKEGERDRSKKNRRQGRKAQS